MNNDELKESETIKHHLMIIKETFTNALEYNFQRWIKYGDDPKEAIRKTIRSFSEEIYLIFDAWEREKREK